MSIRKLLARWTADITNWMTLRYRPITWEEPHGKGTAGGNKFGAWFWIYDMSDGYGEDKRWKLTVSPPCPDGKRFCSVHDGVPYWGPNYDAAKAAAQAWVEQQWPLEEKYL